MDGRKSLILELIIVLVSLIFAAAVLQRFSYIPFLGKYYGLIFAVLFLYVPAFVSYKRGRRIDFLDRSMTAYFRSFAFFLIVSIIVLPLFFAGVHIWETVLFRAKFRGFAVMPDLWKYAAFQVLMVALPEEFFFRGYVQSILNSLFQPKWNILGARLGWAWIITAAIFAFAHSFVMVEWWHFAIFFPALLFGYLRERTGSITSPILFHAASNIAMAWITYLYS